MDREVADKYPVSTSHITLYTPEHILEDDYGYDYINSEYVNIPTMYLLERIYHDTHHNKDTINQVYVYYTYIDNSNNYSRYDLPVDVEIVDIQEGYIKIKYAEIHEMIDDKDWNPFRRKGSIESINKEEIVDGQVECEKCKGVGLTTYQEVLFQCPNCYGYGRIEWINNIVNPRSVYKGE